MANPRLYRVHVLVGDGKPGWMPFTYTLPAETRDAAVKAVRRNIRTRSGGRHSVHHVQSARLYDPSDTRFIH